VAIHIRDKLTPAGKQLVEICRAVAQGSSLPTSSLSDTETREALRIVRDLAKRKMAVIYITHRLEDLRSIGASLSWRKDILGYSTLTVDASGVCGHHAFRPGEHEVGPLGVCDRQQSQRPRTTRACL
jgi:hypothetical protein